MIGSEESHYGVIILKLRPKRRHERKLSWGNHCVLPRARSRGICNFATAGACLVHGIACRKFSSFGLTRTAGLRQAGMDDHCVLIFEVKNSRKVALHAQKPIERCKNADAKFDSTVDSGTIYL